MDASYDDLKQNDGEVLVALKEFLEQQMSVTDEGLAAMLLKQLASLVRTHYKDDFLLTARAGIRGEPPAVHVQGGGAPRAEQERMVRRLLCLCLLANRRGVAGRAPTRGLGR